MRNFVENGMSHEDDEFYTRKRPSVSLADWLPRRYQQLVRLAADGATDKEISRLLGVQETTVRTYWERLRLQMLARSRTEVVAKLYQQCIDRQQATDSGLCHMLDKLPEFVWTSRPDGFVDYCNAWFIERAGRSEAAVLGRGCLALMQEEDLPAGAARWAKAQSCGLGYEAIVHFRFVGDSATRAHRLRLTPVCSSGGEVAKWFGVAYEIDPEVSRYVALI